MGLFKREDIAAFWVDQKVVCGDCITPEEAGAIKEEHDVIPQDDDPDADLVFCDRCGKKVQG